MVATSALVPAQKWKEKSLSLPYRFPWFKRACFVHQILGLLKLCKSLARYKSYFKSYFSCFCRALVVIQFYVFHSETDQATNVRARLKNYAHKVYKKTKVCA